MERYAICVTIERKGFFDVDDPKDITYGAAHLEFSSSEEVRAEFDRLSDAMDNPLEVPTVILLSEWCHEEVPTKKIKSIHMIDGEKTVKKYREGWE